MLSEKKEKHNIHQYEIDDADMKNYGWQKCVHMKI